MWAGTEPTDPKYGKPDLDRGDRIYQAGIDLPPKDLRDNGDLICPVSPMCGLFAAAVRSQRDWLLCRRAPLPVTLFSTLRGVLWYIRRRGDVGLTL